SGDRKVVHHPAMATVIAVDAMGSDKAPRPEVEGAIMAARQHGVEVALVGRESQIRAELALHSLDGLPVHVVAASEVIGMHEKPVEAVRAKRDSSMRVGLRMVREGTASGFVSAGNTGAAMTSAILTLRTLPGVDRPGLGVVFPTTAGTP